MKAFHVKVFCNFAILGFEIKEGGWCDCIFMREDRLLLWHRGSFTYPMEADSEDLVRADADGTLHEPQVIREIEVPDNLPELTRALFTADNALELQVELVFKRKTS